MNNSLDTSIQYLPGVGPKKAKIFNKAGIWTVEDLLYYFPRRYEDRTKFSSVAELKESDTRTIKVQILARGQRQSWKRSRFSILELAVGDDTGRISCVWFNQPYLKEYFKVGVTLILYGKVERYGKRLQMTAPEFEIVSDDIDESLSIGRIVPVYSLLQGVSQRGLRRFIKETLDEYLPKLNDFLPFDIRSKNNLLNLAKSILEIHFPESFDSQKEAYRRLAFQEFFLFQAILALRKSRRKQKQGIVHKVDKAKVVTFINSLPFKLTHSQKTVITEIVSDMEKNEPMQRLLQGDVGSGKTVVAVIACLAATDGGYQAAFMAPTEILAKQHFSVVSSQPPPNGGVPLKAAKSVVSKGIKIALLISSLNKKEKERVYQEIKDGKVDFVIGTHALLQENIVFKNLGLVVIDEQHKFGVGQRALLPQKGVNPDVLIMTATPIPRTLAITLYGDLDVSVINELPAGRIPIRTSHFTFKQRQKAYAITKEQLRLSHQAYIIYPVIEESYALDIAGAKKMYESLKANEFKEFRVGLVHGRQKQDEQDEIMAKFKNKELDVLVSTTVLEVGIDIPEATCMIIENAERFGLSQLHQLRGRVGRGNAESFCLLLSDLKTDDAKARIAAMVKYNNGFSIAEEDLKIRGPGEFFGSRQHGLSELKIGNPLTQMQLLKKAREEAIKIINTDAYLEQRQNMLLKEKLLQRFPEYEKLTIVG